jgi:hypothetical protein
VAVFNYHPDGSLQWLLLHVVLHFLAVQVTKNQKS